MFDQAKEDFENALVKCAQSEALDLATSIHTKLSPELRDIIYGHFWDDATIDRATKLIKRKAELRRPHDDRDCTEPPYACECREYQMPLCVRPDYVGLEIAREAAVYYLKTVELDIEMGSLRTSLPADFFKIGVTTAQ